MTVVGGRIAEPSSVVTGAAVGAEVGAESGAEIGTDAGTELGAALGFAEAAGLEGSAETGVVTFSSVFHVARTHCFIRSLSV